MIISIIAYSMAANVRVRAPAKINLHLRVYGRGPDGYHGILSLFQAISLSDSLVVRSLKEPDAVEIDGVFDCPPERTTLYKAVVAFRLATGIRSGIAVSTEKRLPAGAGLGGGSSDAAALLRALDAIHDTRLPLEELERIGAEVGSDVPFFLSGGAAIVSGRGERIESIASRGDYALALVFPGFPVGTPWAYALLDEERPDDSREPDPSPLQLAASYGCDPAHWPFANSFEAVVSARYPAITEIKRKLRAEGAAFAAMSGSGSSVFGVFDDLAAAEAASARIRDDGVSTFAALPLAQLPPLE
jgi:4-diphosphocytidyl-2-C-methyl-D-erythritol kinase